MKSILKTQSPNFASLVLRLGLAFVFAYAAIDAFRNPDVWTPYLPSFVTSRFNAKTVLDIFSVLQLALVAWLLIGRYLKFAAVFAVLLLGGIVVSNPHSFLITFRDVGLIAASAALFFLSK